MKKFDERYFKDRVIVSMSAADSVQNLRALMEYYYGFVEGLYEYKIISKKKQQYLEENFIDGIVERNIDMLVMEEERR